MPVESAERRTPPVRALTSPQRLLSTGWTLTLAPLAMQIRLLTVYTTHLPYAWTLGFLSGLYTTGTTYRFGMWPPHYHFSYRRASCTVSCMSHPAFPARSCWLSRDTRFISTSCGWFLRFLLIRYGGAATVREGLERLRETTFFSLPLLHRTVSVLPALPAASCCGVMELLPYVAAGGRMHTWHCNSSKSSHLPARDAATLPHYGRVARVV